MRVKAKMSMNFKVLITTSGTGSRLGTLTKNLNKALLPIAGKPVLTWIFESYPKTMEFVITVGYLAEQVKAFVKNHHPDLQVTFALVDRYEGPGTSMGYSMLQARTYLNCPFLIHCCDTLIFEPIPDPSVENWNAGTRGPSAQAYTSFKIIYSSHPHLASRPLQGEEGKRDGYISKIADKGAAEYDLLHIGFVGVKDHQLFWDCLAELYQKNPNDSVLNDTRTINLMLERRAKFRAVEYKTWLDIGSPEALKRTEEYLNEHPELTKK